MKCPASPGCPYCDDDGEWERRMEELDEQARIDAHARDWDPEDMFIRRHAGQRRMSHTAALSSASPSEPGQNP